MKIQIYFFFLLLIPAKYSPCQAEPLKPAELQDAMLYKRLKDTSFYGSKFTNFNFRSATGKEYSNSSLSGKLYVLHFWFTACIPCLNEIPDINALYLRFKDNPDFEFIGLTFDDSATVSNSISQYDIKFPVLSTTETELRKILFVYGKGYPSTFLVGKDGRIMFMSNSLTTDPKFEKRLIPAIAAILADQ